MRMGISRVGGGLSFLQPLLDDRHGIIQVLQAAAGGAELVAVLVVVLLEPAGADAEDESAAGNVIYRAGHVREQVRVAVGVTGDESPDLRPLRNLGHRREHRPALEVLAVRVSGERVEVVPVEDYVYPDLIGPQPGVAHPRVVGVLRLYLYPDTYRHARTSGSDDNPANYAAPAGAGPVRALNWSQRATTGGIGGEMFEGLIPAMVTPFDEYGEVDLDATEAVVDRFVNAGVNGVSILGSTGEFSHLTLPERRRFAEEAAGIVAGRVPLVVGVGATGTREAIELSRHAEETGADGVLVVSPFYWKVGEEALFRHFAAVAESVGIPTLVYNLPLLTGIDLSPTLVRRLAEECPNATGIKDTVTEYSHTVKVLREVRAARPEFAVLQGFEDLILPSVLAGADGSICALANVAPELFVDLVKSARDGDLNHAAELHRRVLALMSLVAHSDPPISAVKLAMKMLGVPISPAVRGPALPVPQDAYPKVEAVLREAGLLVTGEARP